MSKENSWLKRFVAHDYTVIGALCVVIVLGCFAFVIPWSDVAYGAQAWDWTRVKGEVVGTRTGGGGAPSLSVRYAYEFQRQGRFEGERPVEVSSRDHLERLLVKYETGSELEIMVDPDHPERSMLENEYVEFESVIVLLAVSLVLVVIITGVLAFLAWLRGGGSSETTKRRWRLVVKIVLILFWLGLFALLATVEGFMLSRAICGFRSQAWTAVPGRITESRIALIKDEFGVDHELALQYQYEFDGKTLPGRRFSIWEENDMLRRERMKSIVKSHPVGPSTVFVNPADPTQSCLVRAIPWSAIWVVPFPGALSLLALWLAWRTWRRRPDGFTDGDFAAVESPLEFVEPDMEFDDDFYDPSNWGGTLDVPIAIEFGSSSRERVRETLGAGALSAIIATGMLYWASGSESGLELLLPFIVVFALCAAAGLGLALYHAARLGVQGRWRLTLNPGVIQLGKPSRVSCERLSGGGVLRNVNVELMGKEEFEIAHSHLTATGPIRDEIPFHRQMVLRVDELRSEPVSAEFSLRSEIMTTFSGFHNAVIWELRIKANIGRFMPIKVTREVYVLIPDDCSRMAKQLLTEPDSSLAAAPGPLRIHLKSKTANFAPGETVDGEIEWSLESEPKQIRLLLYWRTTGNAESDRELVNQMTIDQPSIVGTRAFSFQLPHGPCSFIGKAITIHWTLELIAEGTHAPPVLKDIDVSHLRTPLKVS